MKLLRAAVAVTSIALFASVAFGQELDLASEDALLKTQQMMRDARQRSEVVSKTQQGTWMDRQVKSMAGSDENAEEMYDLAASIFADLARDANGDPERMMELLHAAKKDPNAFGARLTPEQRERLRQIAGKIPAARIPAGKQ